jgi:hypothetical protein
MGKMTSPRRSVPGGMRTFIVRVSPYESGELHGIVEQVATGLKQRFHGAAEIGRIIREVVVAEKERTG